MVISTSANSFSSWPAQNDRIQMVFALTLVGGVGPGLLLLGGRHATNASFLLNSNGFQLSNGVSVSNREYAVLIQ